MGLRDWLTTHKVPLIVVGCYALLWAVQLIPPHVDMFVWQRWALAAAVALTWWALLGARCVVALLWVLAFIVVFGVAWFVHWLGSDAVRLRILFGEVAESVVIVLLVLVTGVLLWRTTVFVTRLWRDYPRWNARFWIVSLLVLSVIIGREIALSFDFPVTVVTTCDYTVDGDNQLRFTFFNNDEHREADYLFVEYQTATRDWHQSTYVHEYVPPHAVCSRIQSLERDVVWFWTSRIVFVSQNGGATWLQHDTDTNEFLVGHKIQTVTFGDAHHGGMTVWEIRDRTYWVEKYLTINGGRTWVRVWLSEPIEP